jgi:hypothetical protein
LNVTEVAAIGDINNCFAEPVDALAIALSQLRHSTGNMLMMKSDVDDLFLRHKGSIQFDCDSASSIAS